MTRNASRPLDFEELRRAVPLVAILDHYGITPNLKRVGAQLTGCCPIHRGSNPRQFACDLNKNVWRCFSPSCDRGGGMLELVAELENTNVVSAARLVAEWFRVDTGIRNKCERSSTMSGRPSHKVYVVDDSKDDAENDKGWWTRVGSAWPHKDGKGLNLLLQAAPLNGRLVLREYTDEDAAEDDKKVAKFKKK
jgi:hypothetical protein